MYIGELARLTQSTPRAIRLYEAHGLLDVARRGKYRVYDESHVAFIKLIKEAQILGVTLAELAQLTLSQNRMDWSALLTLMAEKQRLWQQQIEQLQAQMARLAHYQVLITDCLQGEGVESAAALDSDPRVKA